MLESSNNNNGNAGNDDDGSGDKICSLEEMNWNLTWMHSNTIDILIPALQINSSLKKLQLATRTEYAENESAIPNSSWIAFGNALASFRGLQFLDISGHPMDEDALKAIGNGLEENSTLTTLILRNCCGKDEEENKNEDESDRNHPLLPVLECLKKNTTLQKLDLSGNDLSESPASLQVLVASLTMNESLKSLSLEDCKLVPDTLEVFLSNPKSLDALEELNLSRNMFHQDGLARLGESMREGLYNLIMVNIATLYSRQRLYNTIHPEFVHRKESKMVTFYASLNRRGRRCLSAQRKQKQDETERKNVVSGEVKTIPASLWPLILDHKRLNGEDLFTENFTEAGDGEDNMSTDLIFCLVRDAIVPSGALFPAI